MRGSEDPRVDRLLDAVLAVGSDLDLPVVLTRIVQAAVTLVDATYGALGVVDQDGNGLSAFITVGIDDEGVARIGPPPTGHGVLGELLRAPLPLRLHDLAQHASSVGFPPGHPPMASLLGVPVRVGAEVFGNLYLTQKRSGQDFTAEDEQVVVALAAAAGAAVRNARLYDDSRRRSAWMDAGRVVSTSLLSGTEREDVVALVVERARDVLGADVAFVALRGSGELHVETAGGSDGPALLHELGPLLMQVLTSGLPQAVGAHAMTGAAVPLGPLGVPCEGVLVVLWTAHPLPWDWADLTGFAAQAAVAFELAERRAQAERSAIAQDRDRIGRDLHDLVIQRLFATGMQLQSAVRLVDQNAVEARSRINHAVDALDETIRELRSTIYGLQAPMEGRPSLRAQILQVVDEAALTLGFAPALRLDGLLDTLATPAIAEQVLAVLREALSNVTRHASASRVEVQVAVHGSAMVVAVTDDGVGMDPGEARSGLVNLATRAEDLGGSLRLSSEDGTRLVWQVPL